MTHNPFPALDVLYLDNHLLVVRKPAGLLVQGDRSGDPTLLEAAREHVRRVYAKPGNVFMGLVHRLDRPVSGVVVFARTSKAAARLSEQFRTRTPRKRYWALVKGAMPEAGELVDRLERKGQTSAIATGDAGQEARLSYRRLGMRGGVSWLEIDLHTGRHHQIRLQLAHHGHPILGDYRYGDGTGFPDRAVALHAVSLEIDHPTRRVPLRFWAEPEPRWPAHFRMDLPANPAP